MTVEPVTVDQPPYPIHALATFELAGYRRQLERAIAYFDAKNPVSSTRDDLQARLDSVIAEEDARAKINRCPLHDRGHLPPIRRGVNIHDPADGGWGEAGVT